MNQRDSTPDHVYQSHQVDPVEKILAEVMDDIECGGDGKVEAHLLRHPELAVEILQLVQMAAMVDRSRPAAVDAVPERFGDFKIVRRIECGGMGEIFEAIQEPLGRRVAIKTIRSGGLSSDRRIRFLREQRILARLHQTNIVPIHAAGQVGEMQYFAMPFIEGASLNRLIDAASHLETFGNTPSLAALAIAASTASQKAVETTDGPPLLSPSFPVESSAKTRLDTRPTGRAGLQQPFADSRDHAPARLSIAYLRSTATVVAAAAEAIQHAHDAGVCHRDLKPSNIMVDGSGHAWIIDFGLAAALSEPQSVSPSTEARAESADVLTRTSCVLGTPAYMAPEQFDGVADARTDVWGLGAVLYELLTFRRPHSIPDGPDRLRELRERVRNERPTPPRRLNPSLPKDLEAICMKAMANEPMERYQTAGEMAADLRRWLRMEPTFALGAGPLRRFCLWSRRNPGWAASTALSIVASLGGFALNAAAAEARAEAADARADAAERQVRQLQRERELHEIHRQLQGVPEIGWSQSLLHTAKRLAGQPSDQVLLRSQATAALQGYDARQRKRIQGESAGVAFDPGGRRLAIAGWKNQPARLWTTPTDSIISSKRTGAGPVGFLKDGSPVQVVVDQGGSAALTLLDFSADKPAASLPLKEKPSGDLVAAAISRDSELIAVCLHFSGANGSEHRTIVWKTALKEALIELPGECTALAISPDSALVALGDAKGGVSLWSVGERKSAGVLTFGRTPVQSLCFGKSRRRYAANGASKSAPTGLLLAAGSEGGSITIRDVDNGETVSHCRGSSWDVHALSFNPDCTLLASAGRSMARLWDVATGKELLQIADDAEPLNTASGIAFSSDGRQLAISSVDAWGQKGRVDVYELENGRGMRTLRGLSAIGAQMRISPDSRYIACLAHDWQLAVWNAATGELTHLFETHRGISADHGGIAFAQDSSLLAFCTGREAKLFDLNSGVLLQVWKLPDGCHDHLAFMNDGSLRLYRFEVTVEKGELRRNVLRVRTLKRDGSEQLNAEALEFEKQVFVTYMPSDGSRILVDGTDSAGRRNVRAVLPDGRIAWSFPTSKKRLSHALSLGPQGAIAQVVSDDDETLVQVVDQASGRVLGSKRFSEPLGEYESLPYYFGRSSSPGDPADRTLFCKADNLPVLTVELLTEQAPLAGPIAFQSNGLHFTWASHDGSIVVMDLPAVQAVLSEHRLGW